MEGKVLNVNVEDGKLVLGVDPNKDGQEVVRLRLNLSESVQEAFSRGEAVEGAKVVDFKLSSSGIHLKLDTDKDGEELLELELDFMEAADEVGDLISKKDA